MLLKLGSGLGRPYVYPEVHVDNEVSAGATMYHGPEKSVALSGDFRIESLAVSKATYTASSSPKYLCDGVRTYFVFFAYIPSYSVPTARRDLMVGDTGFPQSLYIGVSCTVLFSGTLSTILQLDTLRHGSSEPSLDRLCTTCLRPLEQSGN